MVADAVAKPRFRVRGVPVLMYHGISQSGGTPDKYWLPLAGLREQLALMREDGWRSISLAELGSTRNALSVVLTFDDGNASDYECTFPALRANKLSATFFVNTANVGAAGYLDWPQMREMLAAGMSFGSHGHHHTDMRRVGTQAGDDLVRSRQILEQKLGCAIEAFSAPYGSINRRLARLARAAGFRYVCGSHNWLATGSDRVIPRLAIYRHMQTEDFRRLVAGDRTLLLRRVICERTLALPKWVLRRVSPEHSSVHAREGA